MLKIKAFLSIFFAKWRWKWCTGLRIITQGSQHQNVKCPAPISSDFIKTSFFALNSLVINSEVLLFLRTIYLWSVKLLRHYKMYVRGDLDTLTCCFKMFISILIFRRDFKSENKMLPQHLMVVVWKLYYSSRQKVFEGHTCGDALSGEKPSRRSRMDDYVHAFLCVTIHGERGELQNGWFQDDWFETPKGHSELALVPKLFCKCSYCLCPQVRVVCRLCISVLCMVHPVPMWAVRWMAIYFILPELIHHGACSNWISALQNAFTSRY